MNSIDPRFATNLLMMVASKENKMIKSQLRAEAEQVQVQQNMQQASVALDLAGCSSCSFETWG